MSGRSHATGRVHDLNFRAATAIFGHLGIEWDLTSASPEELAELEAWVAFYKHHRHLLLTGDLVRIDIPDRTWLGHGVVAADRGEAIFFYALLDRADVGSPGRLLIPGLDPERRYRVEPLVIGGAAPHGLRPPLWWHLRRGEAHDYGSTAVTLVATGEPDLVLSGRAIAHAGLMAPIIDPEQAVLYLLTAVE